MTERASRTAEVAIVGGGISGCSIAFHLSQAGCCDVVLFEREALAAGATGICPGGIRQQFSSLPECQMARRSYHFWRSINERLEPENPFLFEASGYLFLADSQECLDRFRENVRLQNEVGIPSRILSPGEISALLPVLDLEGVAGGSYCPEDGFLEDCHGVTTLLARRAAERGVRFLYQEVGLAQSRGSGWRLLTGGGSWVCRHLVLAAGVETSPLAAALGVDLPVRRERRRLAFTLPYPEPVLAPLLIAPERAFAGKQLGGGVFYLGWLAEEGGEDEELFLQRIMEGGGGLLPLLGDLRVRRVLAGEYDTTPDHRPILGPVPGRENLHLAVGFSGHGFMIAPAVGEMVAARITGSESGLPLESFSLDRFGRSPSPEDLVI